MNALRGLALLLLFQVAGEGVTHALGLPFPGPVVGLVLLLIGLGWRPVREPVAETAEFLLAHLSLLFVPVGVGVVTHLHLVAQYGLQLLVAIVVPTWAGMAVTAIVLRRFMGSTSTVGACTATPSVGSAGEASARKVSPGDVPRQSPGRIADKMQQETREESGRP